MTEQLKQAAQQIGATAEYWGNLAQQKADADAKRKVSMPVSYYASTVVGALLAANPALATSHPAQAGEVDERVAFEARVVKEAGEGAIAKWLGTEGYENTRVQDNRLGWVWCLEHLASLPTQPAAQATPERHLTVTTNRHGDAVMVSWQDDEHRILEVVWERDQATPEPADDAQVRAIGEGLRSAHDHIEMHKLERSHCKDAERIREGLAAFSAYKRRGDFVATPEPVHCESCGGVATHEAGPDETDLPGAYCDSCGPRAKTTQQAAGEPFVATYSSESIGGQQHDTGRVNKGPRGSFFASTASPEDARLIADALNAYTQAKGGEHA